MYQINIHQANPQLSKLVEEAAQGEEIMIAKAGKPRRDWLRSSKVGIKHAGLVV